MKIFPSCKGNESLNNKTEKGHLHTHTFEARKSAGVMALILGIALVAMACVLASGVLGAGIMYLLAGGAGVLSIPAFIVTAILICQEPKGKVYTLGSAQELKTIRNEQK